jgi:hypothetical protein
MAGDWVWDGTVLVAWWPEASKVGLAANHGPMTSLAVAGVDNLVRRSSFSIPLVGDAI